MKKFLFLSIILAFGFACLVPGDAFAKVKDLHKYNKLQTKSDNQVYAEVGPYLWWATPDYGDETFESDISFTLGVNASIKMGKWGYYGDIFYMNTEDEIDDGNVYAKWEVDEWIFTNAATYYFYKNDRTWLELMLGVRTWHIALEDVETGADTGHSSETWNDLFAGLRFQWEFSQRWYMDLMANYGGFDIDNSKNAYEVASNIGFRINKDMAIKGGYKFISVEYDNDGYEWESQQGGPFVGYFFFF